MTGLTEQDRDAIAWARDILERLDYGKVVIELQGVLTRHASD